MTKRIDKICTIIMYFLMTITSITISLLLILGLIKYIRG